MCLLNTCAVCITLGDDNLYRIHNQSVYFVKTALQGSAYRLGKNDHFHSGL